VRIKMNNLMICDYLFVIIYLDYVLILIEIIYFRIGCITSIELKFR